MKPTVVVDAAAALDLVVSQSGSGAVMAHLVAWRRAGVSLQVPSNFWLELSNSLLRRHRLPASIVIEAIHRLDEFGLQTIELSRPLVLLALDVAERHGLSQYDATYLALAEVADAKLLTADRQLLVAAGTRGIPVDAAESRIAEVPAAYGARAPTWSRYRELSAYLARLRSDSGPTV